MLYFTDFYCRFKRIGKVYNPGDYFGELALQFKKPRAATIMAITPL